MEFQPTGYETLSGSEYVCPVCGYHFEVEEDRDVPSLCPNCGAGTA